MTSAAVRFRPRFYIVTFIVFILGVLLAGCSEPSDSGQDNHTTGDSGSDSVSDTAEDTSTDDSGPDAECSPTVEAGRQIIDEDCTTCHSESLSGTDRQGAPVGLDLDTQSDHRLWSDRIEARAVDERTMPVSEALSDCEAQSLQLYLDEITSGDCTPICDERSCGRDGCGSMCGTCGDAETCDPYTGACVVNDCQPDCTDKACGDDGCGGSCGTCDTGQTCNAGTCECAPACADTECGPDGCGGSCGSCSGDLTCNTTEGTCVESCTPDCSVSECGDDGCGGSCGTCGTGEMCDSNGMCVCAPQCSGLDCGPDGCGGSCGTCSTSQSCVSGNCEFDDVSFKYDVMPIFDNSGCGALNCHAGAQPKARLDMSSTQVTYSELVGVSSTQCTSRLLVEAGNPGSSYLIDKLEGSNMCFGTQMPKGDPPLSTAEIDTIEAWIANGAPNN